MKASARSVQRAAALALATVSLCAWAGDEARVRPLPTGVVSGDSLRTPATAAAAPETWITTPGGMLRVLVDAGAVADPTPEAAPPVVTVTGPGGQLLRVVPGAEPDTTVAPAWPDGTEVVEVGGAKLLQIPGVVAGSPAPDVAAAPLAGMRIVDLPPGAVAPVGTPEPMTLYRFTPGTTAPVAPPAAPPAKAEVAR